MRERIVAAVIDGVRETFRMMLNVEVACKSSTLLSSPQSFEGVSAIIGLVGKASGSFSLHCPEATALKVTERMIGLDVKAITPEVKDAVGELINVIAGVAKRLASERESAFEISIPTIITGKGHSVTPWVKWPNTLLEFTFDTSAFSVIVCMR